MQPITADTVVLPPLDAIIVVAPGPNYPGCAVSLSATALTGATFIWQDDVGNTYSGSEISAIFDEPGSYTFTLTASLDGRTETKERTIRISRTSGFSRVFQKNDDYTRMKGLQPHPDGGFVGFGEYCHTSSSLTTNCRTIGYQLYWHNADGTIRTTRSFGNVNYSFIPKAIIVASDGNVVIAYERHGLNSGDVPITLCLTKMGETEPIIWRAEHESVDDTYATDLMELSSFGTLIVGGYSHRSSNNNNTAKMFTFSSAGAYLGLRTFDDPGDQAEIVRVMEKGRNELLGLMHHNGKVQIVNTINNSISNLNANGYTGVAMFPLEEGGDAAVLSNGNRIKIAHRRANGQLISNEWLSTPGVILHDATLLANGNILVTGTQSVSNVNYGYLAEITLAAELVWEKHQNKRHAHFQGVRTTADCGILAVGYIDAPPNLDSNNEGYFAKLKHDGE